MRDVTPNPVLVADATVLLAVLGRAEGVLRGGAADEHDLRTLGQRCRSAGLLDAAALPTQEAVAGILGDIGQRLRFALGEYDQDPTG